MILAVPDSPAKRPLSAGGVAKLAALSTVKALIAEEVEPEPLGVTVKATEAERTYADRIGKQASDLTEEERRDATREAAAAALERARRREAPALAVTSRPCLDCGVDAPEGLSRCVPCRISEVADLDVRLLPYLRVLRDDWSSRSLRGRHRALVAAHMGASLARYAPDEVETVEYDDCRMQWIVTMHPRPVGYPWRCVLRLGDEGVDAWAGNEGLLREGGA